jgi:hypothetical protein
MTNKQRYVWVWRFLLYHENRNRNKTISIISMYAGWKINDFVWLSTELFKNWMHFFVVLLACKSVDWSTFLYMPIKLQKKCIQFL